MSSIYESLSNVYALTSQINTLRNQKTNFVANQPKEVDPQAVIYEMQRNFNEMLLSLLSSSNEDKEKEKSDPFKSFFDYQNSLLNYQMTKNNTSSVNVNPYTGSVEVGNLNQNGSDQLDLLWERYKPNLNNIF